MPREERWCVDSQSVCLPQKRHGESPWWPIMKCGLYAEGKGGLSWFDSGHVFLAGILWKAELFSTTTSLDDTWCQWVLLLVMSAVISQWRWCPPQLKNTYNRCELFKTICVLKTCSWRDTLCWLTSPQVWNYSAFANIFIWECDIRSQIILVTED